MENLLKNYSKLSPKKKKLVELMLKEKGIEVSDFAIIPQPRNGNSFPASFAQRRLWFLEQFNPGSPLYIIPIGVRVKGSFKIETLLKAVKKIVSRHEILRTSFHSENGLVFQDIHSDTEINIIRIDLSNSKDKEYKLKNIILKESSKPFDLMNLPLFRIVIIKLSENDRILLIPMHHIISDNWSTGILIKEIMHYYKSIGKNSFEELEDLPVQYSDYSVWQQERFSKNLYKDQTEYWINQLKGSNNVLDIITDFKRPSVQTFNGSFELFEIADNVYKKLLKLAKDTDTTLFMILISAFQVLLYRFSNQTDMNIGTPIANRNRAELENLIGFFINTLVIRSDLSGNPTFSKLLVKNKKIALDAYRNQDVPFEEIVDKLKLERNLSHTALFQAMFVLNNAKIEKFELAGVELEPIEIDNGTTKFDLVLSITENVESLKGKFEYNNDLFKKNTIRQLINSFLKILEVISENADTPIDKINIISESSSSVLAGSNLQLNETDIWSLIENVADRYQNKIAISTKLKSISYNDIIIRVNKLSNLLVEQGVKRNQVVGVYMNRSIDYVVSFLAVIRVGAVYLPLDINYPAERLKYILSDSATSYIISDKKNSKDLEPWKSKVIDITLYKNEYDEFIPNNGINLTDTAYIIYTSGSTGKPKGVKVGHKELANHCLVMQKHFNINQDDKELAFAAFNFDASIEQIVVPLISGAEIYLREDEIWSAPQFTKIINEQKLTVINPPTVFWEELTRYWYGKPETAPVNLKLCIAGGDEMKPDYVKMWMESPMKQVRLLNAYGPTESIITSSTSEINNIKYDKLFRTPVGKPLPGRKYYVVDKNLQILPKGFPGELCIGGDLLAKEYLNKPEVTKLKFVEDIFDKHKIMYRTGDLVRLNESMEIEFLGRVDTQVKIRGFRIELGEIEYVLRQNKYVKDAVVTVFAEDGNKYLVAYTIPDKRNNFNTDKLIKYLKNNLPDYMVPSLIITLEKFPLTPSGKVDKKSLPKPDGMRPKLKTEFVMPRTDTEAVITKIVSKVLGINRVGVFDNFFELGGHSMLAMQVISKINEEFDVEIPIKSLFENPTIDGIGNAVLEAQLLNEDENDLESLLNEITGISDEEAKELLSDTDNSKDK